MKKMMLLTSVLIGVALLLAPLTSLLAAGKVHDVKAEVVSVDLEGKKITFKNEQGENQTAPVMDKAAPALKTLKAGDKVILTCLDNENGEHQGITAIKPAPAGAGS